MRRASCKIEGNRLLVRMPLCFKRRAGRKEIILPRSAEGRPMEARRNESMAMTVARAHAWRALFEEESFRNLSEFARDRGMDEAYMRRLLRLTFLAPDIAGAIVRGDEPGGVTIEDLMAAPMKWEEQRRRLGFVPES
jgi:hypothetical protein